MDKVTDTLPEWSNDQRMSALFSRFPERDVNAKVYESRLRFWVSAITAAAQKGLLAGDSDSANFLVVDASLIAERFQRKNLTPLGIGTVVAEMRNSGALVSVERYLNGGSSFSDWSVTGLLKASLSYGLSLAYGFAFENTANAKFKGYDLVPAVVQEFASQIYENVKKDAIHSTDCIRDESIFDVELACFGTRIILRGELDRLLVIKYLENSKKVVVLYDDQRKPKVIKFLNVSSEATTKPAITEADIGIARITKTISSISSQITQLDGKIDQLKLHASEALGKKQRTRALAYLKQKAAVTGVLEKRVSSLHTLETILSGIQQAESEIGVLEAFKTGTKTLSTLLSSPALAVDSVNDVMDNLQDTLAQQREIDDAILDNNSRIASDFHISGVEEEDLERELEGLLAAEGAKEKEKKIDELAGMLGELVVVSSDVAVEEEKQKATKQSDIDFKSREMELA
ncbi:Charged multivesicular body protein 7 [Physocladia obscura]|uniref:Charged multivesicular body protein 7 n=1 Tax=Physocladia obscura TaxID=109957 RepID=A0AAD5XJG3_9FUNG|nr:Charged multivesicular body protein 7 [Physocladia obscura]